MAELGDYLRSGQIEDRRDDPWPWHSLATTKREDLMTPTAKTVMDRINSIVTPEDIPPVTRLTRDLGAHDIGPLSKEEVLKFILDIEMMNKSPEPKDEIKSLIERMEKR